MSPQQSVCVNKIALIAANRTDVDCIISFVSIFSLSEGLSSATDFRTELAAKISCVSDLFVSLNIECFPTNRLYPMILT